MISDSSDSLASRTTAWHFHGEFFSLSVSDILGGGIVLCTDQLSPELRIDSVNERPIIRDQYLDSEPILLHELRT